MADFRPFSPRWGDISFTEAPQTTARCYAGVIFLSYSPSGRHREPAGVEGAARHGAWPRRRWAAAGPGQATSRRVEAPISNPGPTGLEGAGGTRGPGCGARGRWRGLAGLRHDRTPSAAGVEGAGVSGGPGCGAGGWRQGQGGPRDRPLRAFRLACGDLAGGPPPTGTPSSPAQQAPHATTTRVRQRGGYRSTRPLSAHSATASSRLRPNVPQSWRRRRIHRNMPPTTAAPRPAPPIRPSKPVRARPFFGLVAGTSGAT